MTRNKSSCSLAWPMSGEKDDASLALLMRKARQSEKSKRAIGCGTCALCAWACPPSHGLDEEKRLADDGNRELALETCRTVCPSPPVRSSCACYRCSTAKRKHIRISATLALGQIGPFATESVPAIRKSCWRDRKTGCCTLFNPPKPRRTALAHIRTQGSRRGPAARRRLEAERCWLYAMKYLPELGRRSSARNACRPCALIQRKTDQGTLRRLPCATSASVPGQCVARWNVCWTTPVVGWISSTRLCGVCRSKIDDGDEFSVFLVSACAVLLRRFLVKLGS